MRILIACTLLILPGFCVAADIANSVLSLSHYDCQRLDFSALQRAGVEGVIHEATYPAFDSDPKYPLRQSEATRAGMLWGAYHYGNASDPVKQADHFLEVVRGNWERSGRPATGVLLVLDAERNTHYPGGTMQVSQAVEFIKRVHQRTGVYPGFYSGEYWLNRVFGNSVDARAKDTLRNSWLWIANYHYRPVSTAVWNNWALWQYTGDGVCGLPRANYPTSVAGLAKIERTIFSGSRTELRSFWREHSWRPGGASSGATLATLDERPAVRE